MKMLNIEIKNIYRNKISIECRYEMNKILDIVEDIQQNSTDNQYKILMESLMEKNHTHKLSLLTSNYKT